MSQLQRVLWDTYGGPIDRRIKKLEKAVRFYVDGRDFTVIASDKQPFGWFCGIEGEVLSSDSIRVTMSGNVPEGPAVEAWMTARGLKMRKMIGRSLSFVVNAGQQDMLNELADAIMALDQRTGYNLWSACPQSAGGLRQLKLALDKAWANPQSDGPHEAAVAT